MTTKMIATDALQQSAGRENHKEILELIEDYAEARHICGWHAYNAKTAEARAKVVAALTAAPQGGAYAEMPTPHGKLAGEPFHYIADQMRDFADRTHALRASHGQAQQPSTTAADATTVPEGWTDADGDAARLALELECLLTDTKDQAVVSKWWASAHDALELHRVRLASARTAATPQPAPAPQADNQPAQVRGYPPLPDFDTVEQHIYGGCRRYITQDMLEPIHNLIRDAIDADRAARTPADSLEITPPNNSGSTQCIVRWQVETPKGWAGAWNREALEYLIGRAPADSVTAPADGAVAGWKLAPVEPTDAMVQAAHHIDLSYMPGQEGADRAAIYRAMLAAAPTPPAPPADSVLEDAALTFTSAHIDYVARYGGRCRDCADESGVCPGSGLPCADSRKAIKHVFDALEYGVKNGFIKSPIAARKQGGKP